MKGKYLITTDSWFTAPDGNQYKAVWGDVKIVEDSFLGLKTNRNSTNWFAKIGSEENHIIVAGCQIHYAAKSEDKPSLKDSKEWTTNDHGVLKYEAPTRIYIAQ